MTDGSPARYARRRVRHTSLSPRRTNAGPVMRRGLIIILSLLRHIRQHTSTLTRTANRPITNLSVSISSTTLRQRDPWDASLQLWRKSRPRSGRVQVLRLTVIVDCTSCTGWTFLSGCSTSCAQRSIDVCSTKHRST